MDEMYQQELEKIKSEKELMMKSLEVFQRDNESIKQSLVEWTSHTDINGRTYTDWEATLKDMMTNLFRDVFQQPSSNVFSCYDDLNKTMARLIQQQTTMDKHWGDHWTEWNQRYDDLVANLRLDSTHVRSKVETLECDLKTARQDCDQLRQDYEKECSVSNYDSLLFLS
jgi:hypothetical protein